jgi:hypothetical protein
LRNSHSRAPLLIVAACSAVVGGGSDLALFRPVLEQETGRASATAETVSIEKETFFQLVAPQSADNGLAQVGKITGRVFLLFATGNRDEGKTGAQGS